jgi:hypothetical protein
MKRSSIIFLSLCIAVGACKKVSGPADGNSVQPDNNRDSLVSINAKINGARFQTDSAFAYLIHTSGNDSTAEGMMINAIQKNDTPAQTINFYINNFTGPATYTINPPYNTATYYVGTIRHYATSGQIVIVSDTAYSLIGTFNFVADTITVDSGKFNVAMP